MSHMKCFYHYAHRGRWLVVVLFVSNLSLPAFAASTIKFSLNNLPLNIPVQIPHTFDIFHPELRWSQSSGMPMGNFGVVICKGNTNYCDMLGGPPKIIAGHTYYAIDSEKKLWISMPTTISTDDKKVACYDSARKPVNYQGITYSPALPSTFDASANDYWAKSGEEGTFTFKTNRLLSRSGYCDPSSLRVNARFLVYLSGMPTTVDRIEPYIHGRFLAQSPDSGRVTYAYNDFNIQFYAPQVECNFTSSPGTQIRTLLFSEIKNMGAKGLYFGSTTFTYKCNNTETGNIVSVSINSHNPHFSNTNVVYACKSGSCDYRHHATIGWALYMVNGSSSQRFKLDHTYSVGTFTQKNQSGHFTIESRLVNIHHGAFKKLTSGQFYGSVPIVFNVS